MKKIIFTNQKGGVGKSTTCRECGFYLASRGYRTLFIDCDPQGNLTKSLSDEEIKGLFEALEDGIISTQSIADNLFLLAGDFRLSLLEKRYLGEVDAYSRVQDLLSAEEFEGFDFILFDTPPSLNILTLNALSAADHLILPMKPSLYSMQGTNDLMNAVSKVKKNLNPDLSILGVIINEFNPIPIITRQIREEIEGAFGGTVFDTVISKSIKIEEAIALKDGVVNLPGKEVKIRSEVSALGDEILSRLGVEAGIV
ncbi:ParA family protein [Spirochaeta isovalerica]|uniref:Chromosome partitioning protein n=1 Tax=Spirochaeta isovalerica TaxID=150 RepID=A0A841RD30_9SPIO|nr:ParA family protein [Spirochaeta isovalerica]MBB6480888.1 chromosome partitioning protein [Spirochaeta isovalerica]MBB6480900.1 chromosome partitioning protein [Spirochaeta isovalerica]